MQRCLELGKLGQSYCAPNPMVGCVIVHNGQIIGEGYHQKYGEAHAEVNAINNVSEENLSLLQESTLYVNLEPCAHHGKTPPCSQLILDKKIPKVVIGCKDTFSEVAGKGIAMLKEHGVDVTLGILEKESRDLNQRFFTFHEQKRPYIILKMAVSANGFMDIDRSKEQKGIHWITSSEFQAISHQWRSEEAAILIGYNTLINDNPSLTVRAIDGRNPVRIIISKNKDVPQDRKILNAETPTYILNPEWEQKKENVEWIKCENSPASIAQTLHQLGLNSVIIEGGASTLQKFIDTNLWDEARIVQSKTVVLPKGQKAPLVKGIIKERIDLEKEVISIYQNQ